MKKMLMTLTFESQLTYLPIVRRVMRAICSEAIANDQLEDIELSVHEALTNVICHSYENEPGHQIELTVTLSNKEITIQIKDTGTSNKVVPSDPLVLEYDIHKIESLPETGRGVFFIHQLMDEVTYRSDQGENVLILRKHIN